MAQTPSWVVYRVSDGKTYIINKLRMRRTKWGPGKVHWVIYNPEWNAYYKACQTPDDLLLILGGEYRWGNVPKNAKVTCKRCLRKTWLNV